MVNKGRGDDALVPLNTPPTAPHARRAPARDSRRGLAAARARSVPRHVVVVDPDPGMAVVTVLLRRVCRVTASDTASATVTDLRRLRPDLVIFDSDLQDLDVVAFGRALRTRYPGCPIVVVSANANVGALREMMEMPIDGFFKKPVRIDRLFEHIATLLPDLEAGGHVRPRPGPYINHALGEIAQRYKDRLSLGAIARSVNISRAYLARLFKRQTGATVRQFLLDVRMEIATRLLVRSEEKLDQIARDVGFADGPHFSRSFHRRMGRPPGNYRRRAQDSLAS